MAKVADKIPAVKIEQWELFNKFNKDTTEEFLLESTQLSNKTLEGYKSALGIFFYWVYENLNNISLLEIKGRDFLKFQNWLTRRGMSPSGVRFKRAAISSLNGYIILYYEDLYPTFKNFITKKISAPPPAFVHEKQPMDKDEWELVIKTLTERKEWQKLAYLHFTYSSGCRREESRQLWKEDVNSVLITKVKDGKDVLYYQTHDTRCKGSGKAGKVRKLQFSTEAMDAMKKWLEVRGEDDCPFMFVAKYAGKINQVSENVFNNWMGEVEELIGRRVHPHQIREKRATDMVVVEGKNIKSAQKLLGHNSSETTQIYVIRNTDDDIDDAFS